MEVERMFKCSHDRRDIRKRRPLVAAASASSFTTHHEVHAPTTWPTPALMSILVAILVLSTCIFRHENAATTTTPSLIDVQRFTAAALPCSGQGYLESTETGSTCKCHECFGGRECADVVSSCVIDLDHGDPTMFEEFWFRNAERSATVILGYQRMSYFAHSRHVWFMEKDLEDQIRALHRLVGNAVTDGRHIVVGTGSTQLFQAALFALTSRDQPTPTRIVSAAPFYSSYPAVTDYMRSALFQWAGDAASFDPEDGQPFIELVTSPNNPDGRIQHAVVKKSKAGHVVHDLAYFWPHYTPITAPADHETMLFTLSKSTGHAGTRIGWAIVKDEAVAKRMTKFMELNTIGVSHDSQVRATQIIKAVVEADASSTGSASNDKHLFHFGAAVMQYRWTRLRSVLNVSAEFEMPEFEPARCTFFRHDHARAREPTPAFAWLRCLRVSDCEALLKAWKIVTRSGRHFGVGRDFVRLSMLDRSRKFEMLVDRLARIDSSWTPG